MLLNKRITRLTSTSTFKYDYIEVRGRQIRADLWYVRSLMET